MMQFKSKFENILYQAVLRFKYAQAWLSSALPWLTSPKERAEIILHIGAPKTGTSAIQRFCLRNRLALLRAGFYYPEHGIDENGISGGHALICQPGASGTIVGWELFQAWLAIAKKANLTLLLSSENFYGRASALWPMLQDKKVKIVGWYRHPVELIVSGYNQSVKRSFWVHTLDQRCRNFLQSPNNSRLYDGHHLHEWANFVSDAHCAFYPFVYSASQPIETLLLEAIGLTRKQQSVFKIDGALINRSYIPDALEFKRRLNLLLTREDIELNQMLDVFLQAYSDKSAHATSDAVALPAQTLQQLQQYFAQGQTALLQRFPALAPALLQAVDERLTHKSQAAVSMAELQHLWGRLVLAMPETAAVLRQRLHSALEANKSAGLHEVAEVIAGEPPQAELHAATLSERS